jgi:hypothetical protein
MVVVRPKATPLPRIEEWEVLREDPETGDVEKFRIECAEGHFYTFYRNQGLIDGTEPYDPYLDLDEGRLKRKRIAVYR